MMSDSNRMGISRIQAARTLAAVIGALLAGSVLASDPLTLVPSDVAGVVVFRDLKASAKKINPFLKQISDDFEGLDPDELGQAFNIKPENWDASAQVMIVLTKPEFARDSLVVGFKPAEGSELLVRLSRSGRKIWKREGPNGEISLTFRDGWAFAGKSTKALRSIRSRSGARSFAGVLDEQEKALLSKSDAFARLDFARWREKISPLVMLSLGMMKLGVAAETPGDNGACAMMDWLSGGIRAFVDQMESTSVAFSFDRETIRLDHHHRFTSGQSVANYLATMKPGKEDLLDLLPDRRFLMLCAANWHCSQGPCLTVSLSRHVMELETVVSRTPEETRQKLTRELNECYGEMRGSAFMVTSRPGQVLPLQLIGGYSVKNPAQALQQLCFIQENAGEAMSSMLPGSGCTGKFVRRRQGDVDFMEMSLATKDLSKEMREELNKVYGENVRYQQAAGGPDRVVYTFAGPPTSVVDFIGDKAGQRVNANPAVRRIVDRLPSRPHMLIVFDMEQALAAVPYLAGSKTTAPSAEKPAPSVSERPSRGLIGWAAVVRPTSISGHFAMDAQDAIESFKLAQQMPQKLTKISKGARGKVVVNP